MDYKPLDYKPLTAKKINPYVIPYFIQWEYSMNLTGLRVASRGSAPAAHRFGSRAGSHIRGEISPEGSTMDVPLGGIPCLLHIYG